MTSEKSKHLALVILGIAFMVFVYGSIEAVKIVSKTQVGTSGGIYTSYVSRAQPLGDLARELTRDCRDTLCQVQTLLNFTTAIPYQSETFQQSKPEKTIAQNFGDCDDKSNLLISLLHALEIKAYFVLVPKHIFIMLAIEDERLAQVEGLWINHKKYYILESTATGSLVGYPLHYSFDEIDTIVEPFSNTEMHIETIAYKL